ncbi:MAG: 30S ribosomal protein S11, partial [Parcubacteria group bacterium]|nr:30S ribosomal protein S11 [Parcubacteria group bacterium]
IITITDLNGRVVFWGSAGVLGFKGAKRSTPFAATEIAKYVVENIKETGLSEIDVFVRGVGGGRESAIRALNTYGLKVISIKDVTPIPHNGCRPPKVRRV